MSGRKLISFIRGCIKLTQPTSETIYCSPNRNQFSAKFPREERRHALIAWQSSLIRNCIKGIIRWANEGMGNEGTEEVDDNEGWVILEYDLIINVTPLV